MHALVATCVHAGPCACLHTVSHPRCAREGGGGEGGGGLDEMATAAQEQGGVTVLAGTKYRTDFGRCSVHQFQFAVVDVKCYTAADTASQARGLQMAALLVDRLTAEVPAPRMSAMDDAARRAPSWCSNAADSAAVALAQPQLLGAQLGAQPLLGALLAGSGPGSGSDLQLLRLTAAARCLQQLHTHMQQALGSPGAAPSPLLRVASEAPATSFVQTPQNFRYIRICVQYPVG